MALVQAHRGGPDGQGGHGQHAQQGRPQPSAHGPSLTAGSGPKHPGVVGRTPGRGGGGPAFGTAVQQGIEAAAKIAGQFPREWLDLAGRGPVQHDPGVAAAVGRLAGGREAQRGPQGEDVAGRGGPFAAGLLGSHVLGGADDHLGPGQTRGGPAHGGHAEVGQVGPTVPVEQDVGRLDVAVHDAGPVGRGQRPQQGVGQVVHDTGRQRPPGSHVLPERAARQVRHDQHHVVVLVDHVEQGDDVGVVQRRQRLGFAADALAGAGHLVGAAVQGQALEGDRSAGPVEGQVDHAHPAATQPAHERVGHVDRVGGPRHRRESTRDTTERRVEADQLAGTVGADAGQITRMKPSCHRRWLQCVRDLRTGARILTKSRNNGPDRYG